jgi:hypothetical protein
MDEFKAKKMEKSRKRSLQLQHHKVIKEEVSLLSPFFHEE